MNAPESDRRRCLSRKVKTLGLQHTLTLNMSAGSEPSNWAYTVHHRTDELLIKQHTVSDRQAAATFKE